ncbi:aldo/keto reductase [Pseudomonas sp. Pseusp122]|uniref:aldo/keto reductase n=1 Tax=unclassified Pseudomonas TaxID=196821 RepID=UPI0039A70E41
MKYKLLGKTGVRVSEFALGTANFGTDWGHGADEAESLKILNAFEDAGGNFLDTADIYQFGQSEAILGKLLEGRREDFFLASKYTYGASPTANRLVTGNSRRSMTASVEASLKRLKTDRIDLYWVHNPDSLTPAEELVRGLDDLARAGKILYAGLSNFPAWRLSRAVTLAELTHAVPIAAAQFEYSLVHRTPESDVIEACEALGLASITWSPLGGGMLTGKYRNGETGRAEAFGGKVFQAENNQKRTAILDAVLEIAKTLRVSPDQVAIAWVASRGTIPILGPRSLTQLSSNVGAQSLALSEAHLTLLNAASSADSTEGPASAAGLDMSNTETPGRVVA